MEMGGLNYITAEANLTSYSGTISVACPYTDFCVLAEARTPNRSSNNYIGWMAFTILNGGSVATFSSGANGYVVKNYNSAWQGASISPHASLTNGVLSFTSYSSGYMSKGVWDVLIVELPRNMFSKLPDE